MAKFLVLIYGDEHIWEAWTPEQERANGEQHGVFTTKAGTAVLGGHELERSADAVSLRRGEAGTPTVTNGPFLQADKVIGGFYLLEAATVDEAVELASLLPEVSADHSGVEIRPVKG